MRRTIEAVIVPSLPQLVVILMRPLVNMALKSITYQQRQQYGFPQTFYVICMKRFVCLSFRSGVLGVSFCGWYCPNVIVLSVCGGTWRCEQTLFCVEIVKRHLSIFIPPLKGGYGQPSRAEQVTKLCDIVVTAV